MRLACCTKYAIISRNLSYLHYISAFSTHTFPMVYQFGGRVMMDTFLNWLSNMRAITFSDFYTHTSHIFKSLNVLIPFSVSIILWFRRFLGALKIMNSVLVTLIESRFAHNHSYTDFNSLLSIFAINFGFGSLKRRFVPSMVHFTRTYRYMHVINIYSK